ncbi:cyclin-like protein [Fennellomyces sp. T-0311]|nr:cyclin-like protein [Fennellomyces sp. T-0311]
MAGDQWLFSKDDLKYTPTVTEGFTVQQEQQDRTKGCLYLLAIATKLNLSQLAVATACTFFHRFYMRRSMMRYHVYDIAATSLFVATKVEESTRRIKDFVNVCAQKAQKNDKLILTEDSKDFIKWKDTMLCNEATLLETLCFDISIEHPHTHLLEMGKRFDVPAVCIKQAWMILYQALGLPLCLLYRPNLIAAAALLLACYLLGEDPPGTSSWESVGVDPGQANELAIEILEFFEQHYIKKAQQPMH